MRYARCLGANGESPPSARFGHTATAVKNARFVVVFGGLARGDGDFKGALADVVAYDARADAWFRPRCSQVAPRARAFHSACALRDSKIIIACGRDGREQFGDCWMLDCETWTWTRYQRADVAPRDFASIVAVDGDTALMFGGFNGKTWIADVDALRDASSATRARWFREDVANERNQVFDELPRAALETIGAVTSIGRASPEARSGHAAVLYGANVLIHGGQGANGGAFSDTWCLRREADGGGWRWVKLVLRGHAPNARAGHAMGVLTMANGAANVVISGGVGEDGWLAKKRVYFDDAYYLDGDNARWEKIALANDVVGPGPRSYHTLTMVGKNKCLSFGGFNGTKACGDAWWLIADDAAAEVGQRESTATSSRALIDGLRSRLKVNESVDVFEGNDAAFRQHLTACDPDDLRVGDVPKLMREYVAATSTIGLPDQHRDGPGRYRHCDPTCMKIKDVSNVLTELQGAFIANA